MKTVFLLLVAVIVIAVAAGIIVVHRQGTHACVTYYNKNGTQELNKDCKQ
jgi:hypothetical protein